MDHDIIQSTKKIVLRKNAEEAGEELEARMQNIEDKLDIVLRMLAEQKNKN